MKFLILLLLPFYMTLNITAVNANILDSIIKINNMTLKKTKTNDNVNNNDTESKIETRSKEQILFDNATKSSDEAMKAILRKETFPNYDITNPDYGKLKDIFITEAQNISQKQSASAQTTDADDLLNIEKSILMSDFSRNIINVPRVRIMANTTIEQETDAMYYNSNDEILKYYTFLDNYDLESNYDSGVKTPTVHGLDTLMNTAQPVCHEGNCQK